MIILDILEEHLEEAGFLWQQRENALFDRVYDLDGLADLEERLLAHLDGLVLAGKDGWKFLKPKLAKGELGEVFAAAFVALESGDAGQIDLLQKTLNQAEGEILDGIRHALRHTNSPEAEKIVRPLLNAEKIPLCAAALDIFSFRRLPLDGGLLQALLGYKDPIMTAEALKAIGRLKMVHLKDAVERDLEAEDPGVRREAMGAGLLLGSPRGLEAIRKTVAKRDEESLDAILLLGLAGHAEDVRLLVEAFNEPAMARGAIVSLGWLGNVAALEPLIRFASDPKLSRLAGEGICILTGVDLKKENLLAEQQNKPHTAAPDATEDADAELEVDPDEGLLFPDPDKLAAWWRANVSRFDKKIRYRKGQPHGKSVLIDTLKNGNLPERHHAAFDLALIDPSQPLRETCSFSIRQRTEPIH